jgi:hypothetical protein
MPAGDQVVRQFTVSESEGIAEERQRRSIQYARTHGFRTMPTSNDPFSRPIGSILERLRFRPFETPVHRSKSLSDGRPSGGSVDGRP